MRVNRPDAPGQWDDVYQSQQEVSHQEGAHLFSINGTRFAGLPSSQPYEIREKEPDTLFTVINVDQETWITEDWLRQTIVRYRSADDVFRDAFLYGVVFNTQDTKKSRLSPEASDYLDSLGNSWVQMTPAAPSPGPYLAFKGQLFEAYRLYDDTQGAFVTGVLPSTDMVAGETAQTFSVAVPSRLRHLASDEKPLAGFRVAVKDNFAIQGIKTSLCNQAYHELYPAATKTAACIEFLRQRGAVIVGTTKLASFAATEEPLECIDYQAPWNPRADGHQSPAGSSSGSGAAIASYPWLDIAIGSDTSGSGRRPGHWNGCYAMRPSHGVLPVDGYTASFRQFDVPTFFGRGVATCKAFASEWYGYKLPEPKALPPRIIYPLDYMSLITNKDQLRIIDNFVVDLEAAMRIKHERVSLASLWDVLPPVEAGGQSLHEYMKHACRDSFFHDDYHNFDSFRQEYQDKFAKTPYVSPPVQWQWNLSETITQAARDTAIEKLEVYRKWFCETVMRGEEHNTIIIIPIENMSPRYRDEARTCFDPVGVPMLFLSPIIQGPEFTVPIGQVPFESRVSGRTEGPANARQAALLVPWSKDTNNLQHCPVLLASHGVALRRAYQQQLNFRQFLLALAGVIFFGTPHSTSEDIESWQNPALLVQAGLLSKKKKYFDPNEIEKFARFSLRFEQACVVAPILSIYETQPTKIKSPLWSVKKNLPVQLTGRDFVATKSRHEEFMALDTDHKNLCNIDVSSAGFNVVTTFLTTVVEDTRLKIIRGSPKYKAASALDHWTVRDPNEAMMTMNEGQPNTGSESNSAPQSDPFTKEATLGSSEDGFEIIRQLTDMPSGRQGSHVPCHIIPVAHNKAFFGRAAILQEISNMFFDSVEACEEDQAGKEVKTFAICGPGGMGKTQIATEFVYRHKDRFDAILWIYADKAGKIAESFTRMALKLGLVAADSMDSRDPVVTRDLVKGWLANPMKTADPADELGTGQASWLIVFDNADNPDQLEDFWPLDGPGCVLFTSRDPLAKHANYLALNGILLEPFDPEEGSRFLTELTQKPEDSSDVVRILGGLPLALTQMAGIIVRHEYSFEEFTKIYSEEENRKELMQLRLDQHRYRSGYEHTLASVWALESLNHGRFLLEVLSFLDPDRIQECILTTHSDVVAVDGFPKSTIAYHRARTELQQSSLITRSSEELQVHRLIQDAARSKIGKERTIMVFSSTVALVSSIWPFQDFDWRHGVSRWRKCGQLLPHVLSLEQHHSRLQLFSDRFEENFQFAKLLTDAGWFYHECGRSSDSERMFASAQSIAEKLRSSIAKTRNAANDSERAIKDLKALLAEIHHNLGCVGTESNDPAATLKHFQMFNELMRGEIAEEAQGKDKRLAISWNELGNAHMLNDQWEEGERSFKKSIVTMQGVNGFQDIDNSFAMVNLGLTYWLSGRQEDAVEVLMEGLRVREVIHGLDDRESFITGRFLHALGNVKSTQGFHEDSQRYHERALAQYLSTIGQNHHRTGDLHVKVAEHHFRRQEYEEALLHLDQALRVFAPRAWLKPEKARAMFKRSLICRALDRQKDAIRDQEESLQLYCDIKHVGRANVEDLTAEDFDKVVAFWSR
ncbi:MAG: hypothetical protein Q9170_004506 [Blastenia crenularia]